MTTSVVVSAHCSSDKEVRISIKDGANKTSEVMQDGETKSFTIYDNRKLAVVEVVKQPPK